MMLLNKAQKHPEIRQLVSQFESRLEETLLATEISSENIRKVLELLPFLKNRKRDDLIQRLKHNFNLFLSRN
jgi:hypothetical protein